MAFFDIKPAVGITVEAAEGYDQSYSGMQALIEGYQNDYALFTGALYQDIKESTLIHEGASESEVVSIQEASISGFLDKIKEFFLKLWRKIKALFHNFIAKFDSMFMKSGKELLKKYRKELEMKTLTDCEVTFSMPIKDIKLDKTEVSIIPNQETAKKDLEDFDADEYACNHAGDFLGGFKPSSMSDFDKDLHDYFFEDKETDIKWPSVESIVYGVLENDDLVKNTKKSADVMDTAIGNIVKEIEKAKRDLEKGFKDKDNHPGIKQSYVGDLSNKSKDSVKAGMDFNPTGKEGYNKKQTVLNLAGRQASAIQSLINKMSAGMIREAKFHASQCRAALAKAVAYKAPKNEAANDTIADAIAYDPSIVL